ncbi:lipoprotein [Caudoviricetes sp.]|jgi:hypothetical protein|nr:lipoprotein [Caudoviricetes sp.]
MLRIYVIALSFFLSGCELTKIVYHTCKEGLCR